MAPRETSGSRGAMSNAGWGAGVHSASAIFTDPPTTPVLKYNGPPLNDWRADRLRRRNPRNQRHKESRDPSVRNHKSVFAEAVEPWTQAVREHSVAFPALGHKRPAILAPGAQAFGVLGFNLRPGQPFPDAETELLQDGIEAVALGREAHCVARDLHRLPRALKRRGKKGLGFFKPVDLPPDKAPQRSADRARLLAPTCVERNIELSLKPALGVVRRLAVAHEDQAMRKFRHG